MYTFKTYGRDYQFTVESDGLIHCKDLGLKAETVEALKPLVSEAVKKEKAAPRIPVIILEDRWGYTKEYTFGSASSKADRHGYRWVSYKDSPEEVKTKRRTFDSDRLALDTPANREIAAQMMELGARIVGLQQQQAKLRSQLQRIGDEQEVE